MSAMIQNPTFKCCKCGKEEVQKGAVTTGIPTDWVCGDCRKNMKKIMTLLVIYEDGFHEFSGVCDWCKTFPCKHISPDGRVGVILNGYTIVQPALTKEKKPEVGE